MARKIKESPLNLIQILPPKNGKSPSKPYNLASTHFKIQIDAEDPAGWMRVLARSMAGMAFLFRSISSILQRSFNHVKRACGFATGVMKAFTKWLGVFVQKIAHWTVFRFTSLVKTSKKVSQWIHVTGKHTWMKWMKTKQRSRGLKIELRNVRTIEQRGELIQEVHALRDQLSAHQDELLQVTTQMGELKALVLSQQQVLLHLGKELEAAEKKAPPLERLTPRKAKSKAPKPKKPESSEMPSQPALATDAHH